MLSEATRKKLTLLLPLLASDKDGEVTAAARQIGKALAADGKDFHDLVKALGREPTVVYRTVFREPEPEPQSDWQAMAAYCAKHRFDLAPREADFVVDMEAKLSRWREPTEKQAAWLQSIWTKLRRRYGEAV